MTPIQSTQCRLENFLDRCLIQGKRCECVLSPDTNCMNEKTQVSLEKELFVRVYGLDFAILVRQPMEKEDCMHGETSLVPALS